MAFFPVGLVLFVYGVVVLTEYSIASRWFHVGAPAILLAEGRDS